MADLFSKTPTAPEVIDPNADHYSELVGEGKKYRDNAALAYAARKKDEHIRNLEREQEELRKELEKRLTMEDFVDKMKNASTQVPQPRTPSNAEPQAPSERVDNSIKPEEIAKLVDERFQDRVRQTEEKENLEKVKRELMKHWGSDYQAKLKIAAQQLDVSEGFIDNLGKTHPDALLRLLEIRESKNSEYSPPPRGGVAPVSNPNNLGERDWKYFEKLRKENPSMYFSRKVQSEIHRLAMEGKLEIPR